MTTPRITPLADSDWDPEIRPMLEATAVDGRVFNVFRTLAHHPKLFKRWLPFGTHILLQSSLSARDRELVILRVGWLARCEYEFGQHRRIGAEAGLSDEEIRRVTAGPQAAEWSEGEAALLRAVDQLHGDTTLDDEAWRGLTAHYDTTQVMDLIFTVGQYGMLAMALNALRVARDPGVPGFPE